MLASYPHPHLVLPVFSIGILVITMSYVVILICIY